MKITKGISRRQRQFISPDDLVATDNPVRIIDAFCLPGICMGLMIAANGTLW